MQPSLNIYDVTIYYTHETRKRRKRNRKRYLKSVLVRAPDGSSSASRASSIFLRLHPNAKIVEVDAMMIAYPENKDIRSVSEQTIKALCIELKYILENTRKAMTELAHKCIKR